MDKVFLRKQLLQHKDLLKGLKTTASVAKSVHKINDQELNILLKILHLVGDGVIHILKKHSQLIQKSKKEKKLAEIGSRVYFKELMKQSRATKLSALKTFYSVLPAIIDSMFN